MNPLRVAVVGLGRASMSDDAVGLRVAQQLAHRGWHDLDVACVATEEPLSILSDPGLLSRDLLIFIDASPDDADHSYGSCVKIDLSDPAARILHRGSLGTHGIGLDTALRLGEELGCLPDAVWVYLIFANYFGRGLELTPAMSAEVDSLVNVISGEIETWSMEAPCTSSR